MRGAILLVVLMLSGCASLSTTGARLVEQMYDEKLLTEEERELLVKEYISVHPFFSEPRECGDIYYYLNEYSRLLPLTNPSEIEISALNKFKSYAHLEWQKTLKKRKFMGTTLQSVSAGVNQESSYSSASNNALVPDAYGPGIHQNRYGQPVTVAPDHGGVQGEMLKLKIDAYGPGIHQDQYGRPVREYPAFGQ